MYLGEMPSESINDGQLIEVYLYRIAFIDAMSRKYVCIEE